MKLIIAGPPHSGKSVFISMLKTKLEDTCKLYPLRLDATPDGETNYVKENYADPELIKRIRKKGSYACKLRKYIKRCVTNSEHPLMLIDIGGKFNDKDKEMLENATHAIILSGGEVVTKSQSDEQNIQSSQNTQNSQNNEEVEKNFVKSVGEWTEFFESLNIPIIASIYSDYNATLDYISGDGSDADLMIAQNYLPKGTLAIHHLDRDDFEAMGKAKKEAIDERPNVGKVAEIICSTLKNQNASGANDYDALKEISATKELKEDNDINVCFSGAYSQHKLAKLCIDEIVLDKSVSVLDSKLGEKIPIKPLEMGSTQREWFDEPIYIGQHKGRPIYRIRTLLNHSQNILLPEDLAGFCVPKVPDNSIVSIASTGSQWFGSIVAASYIKHCYAVAIHMPNVKLSAIVWSQDESALPTCDVGEDNSKPVHLNKAGDKFYKYIDGVKKQEEVKEDSKGIIADKSVVYIDMDGVLADFDAGKELILGLHPEFLEQFAGKYKDMPKLFESLPPIEGGIEAAKWISEEFDAYILTSAPWNNQTALQAKQDWIRKYFTDENGFNPFKRKLIITHHKELLIGDILIDDRNTNGVYEFGGVHIWFGKKPYENWAKVRRELEKSQVANSSN